MKRTLRNDVTCVSEVLGSILLIAIAVSCFSVLYVYAPPQVYAIFGTPQLNCDIVLRQTKNVANFEHFGGESFDYIFTANGEVVQTGNDFCIGETKTIIITEPTDIVLTDTQGRVAFSGHLNYDPLPPPDIWPTTIIMTDDFELGFGNYSHGSVCSLDSTIAHSGTHSIMMCGTPTDSCSFWLTNSLNLTNSHYQQIIVDFWYYAKGCGGSDKFYLQYYNGTAWQTVLTRPYTSNLAWYHIISDINRTNYNFPNNAKIKFVPNTSMDQHRYFVDQVFLRVVQW